MEYLFFCDIDGTLLQGDSGIAAGVREAARDFRRAGGLLTLCTGRAHISTRWVAEAMEIEIPCILYNGAVLYDFNGKGFVDGTPLPQPVVDRLPEVLRLYPEFSLQAYGRERIYLLNSNPMFAERGVQEEIEPFRSSFADIDGDIYKLVMAHPDADGLRRCCERFFADELCHFAFASRHFVEVVARGVGKGHAAVAMAQRYGIPLARTFAAGDGHTDLPVMEIAAMSYAPDTASSEVRAAAKRIVPAAVRGGMAEAFADAVRVMREGGA